MIRPRAVRLALAGLLAVLAFGVAGSSLGGCSFYTWANRTSCEYRCEGCGHDRSCRSQCMAMCLLER